MGEAPHTVLVSEGFDSMLEAVAYMQSGMMHGFHTAGTQAVWDAAYAAARFAPPFVHHRPPRPTLLGPEFFGRQGSSVSESGDNRRLGNHAPRGGRPVPRGRGRGVVASHSGRRSADQSSTVPNPGRPSAAGTSAPVYFYPRRKTQSHSGYSGEGTSGHSLLPPEIAAEIHPGPGGDDRKEEMKTMGVYSTAGGGGSIIVQTGHAGHIGVKIVYTREFLLQAASSPYSTLSHEAIPFIAFELPEILRPIPGKLRAKEYKNYCRMIKEMTEKKRHSKHITGGAVGTTYRRVSPKDILEAVAKAEGNNEGTLDAKEAIQEGLDKLKDNTKETFAKLGVKQDSIETEATPNIEEDNQNKTLDKDNKKDETIKKSDDVKNQASEDIKEKLAEGTQENEETALLEKLAASSLNSLK